MLSSDFLWRVMHASTALVEAVHLLSNVFLSVLPYPPLAPSCGLDFWRERWWGGQESFLVGLTCLPSGFCLGSQASVSDRCFDFHFA